MLKIEISQYRLYHLLFQYLLCIPSFEGRYWVFSFGIQIDITAKFLSSKKVHTRIYDTSIMPSIKLTTKKCMADSLMSHVHLDRTFEYLLLSTTETP